MMNEPQRGMTVLGSDGPLGTVDDVIYEPNGGTARVVVHSSDGQSIILQPGSYEVRDGVLRLDGATLFGTQANSGDAFRTQRIEIAPSAQTIEVDAGEERVIPVVREQVNITRREIERGGIRAHKRVEEREEVVEQPTYREEISVERVALGRPIDAPVATRQEGDTLIIPVLEEVLVVEKRLVLKEEIRITKRRTETTEQARIRLREEHVDIEELGDDSSLA